MADRYAALLRGVNLGKKRVPMAELKELLEELGCKEVRTLLNSGNAVFTSGKSAPALTSSLERGIVQRFGFTSRVSILSAGQVAEIISDNPIGKVADNPSKLLVSVYLDAGARKVLTPLTKEKWHPEVFGLGDLASYTWCASGIIESKVLKAVDKVIKNGVTARNWGTMLKLHAMMGGS